MQPYSPLMMFRQRSLWRCGRLPLLAAAGLLVTTLSLRAEQDPAGPVTATADANEAVRGTVSDQPSAVVAARQRAELMHAIYAETLHVMHERYFHGSRAIVPARA